MPSIVIREKQIEADKFTATLIIDGASEYTVAISNPFSNQEETRLEWYFEEWLKFPFLDTIRAGKAAESVKEYGKRLFEQVFSDRNAFAEYAASIRPNLRDTRIEIFGGPEFHALHWEAMWDSQLPRPFAVECVTLRKHTTPVAIRAEPNPSPVINLLVVTARPDSETDVGYRTISRPLIEAIRKGNLRVNVELLRPGTYEALSKHLEEKGAGFYHVVHFDLHGGLMNYAGFQQGARADRYTFQARYGRADIQPYTGQKAFLLFEGDTRGKADPVEADEIAALLTGKGVPICILNACQSGKQVADLGDGRETSLGSRLMAAGMQMVVAMGYSVTVSAAALFVEETYRNFFQQSKTETALRLGRLELFNRKNRRAYYNQTIELEDWLLPVVYANRPVDLKLNPFSPGEEEAYLTRRSETFRAETPTYGFFGRDLDILGIERLLCAHNMLLVQGMGGTGKTTLLNHLREWWETTGFIERSFYFGYDQRAWTLDQLLHEIGQKVFDRFEQATFLTFGTNAKIERLAEKLNGTRFCLMLDNLESVTGQPLAIQNTLDETERNRIRDFLAKLKGGKTFVVLGSRGGEGWLKAKTFGENRYALRGLDPEARSGLAEAVLKRHITTTERIEEIRKDDEFKRLMKLLAGYPLAIEVVLPNLRRQSPAEVVAALGAADLQLDNEDEDKTRSIIQCVEYSHGNLSPETQDLLLCIALFTGHLNLTSIPNFVEKLKLKPELARLDFSSFEEAIQETINWGLLSPIGDGQLPILQIQPVLPFFLKNRLARQTDEFRRALEDCFLEHFDETAKAFLNLMESKAPREQQVGFSLCNLDYENLYSALKFRLQRFESISSISSCLIEFLEKKNDLKGQMALAQEISTGLESYPLEARNRQWAVEFVGTIDQVAFGLLLSKQLLQARAAYQKALCEHQAIQGIETSEIRRMSASIHHQLGVVAGELREFDEARRCYQQALDIFIEFNAHYQQASTYHQLGLVAQKLRQFDEAHRCYRKALDIDDEFNTHYDQASTYHQLGMMAQELREFDEARRCYQKALGINIEFNDRYNQAKTYHQLGTVALDLREFDEARRCYRQALDIKIEFNDRSEQAAIYHQLGTVALDLREFDEARRCYRQALDIKIEFNARYDQAKTYHQLGTVAQELREFDEARRYYRQALDIKIEFNARDEQAVTYHQLGMVAQALREFDEAQRCYQKALDIKIEFNARYDQTMTYHQLGMVAQALREFDEARRCYRQALDIWKEFHEMEAVALCLHSFAELFRESGDQAILEEIAEGLGINPEEARELLDQVNAAAPQESQD